MKTLQKRGDKDNFKKLCFFFFIKVRTKIRDNYIELMYN